MSKPDPDAFSAEERETLASIAEQLIPAAHGMPSAREAGVAQDHLDEVLTSRPDLEAGLRRALRGRWGAADARADLEELRTADQAAHDALLLVIVGGYYLDSRVRGLIGYPGQVPKRVSVGGRPPFLEEDLLDAVIARGPRFREADS